MMATKEKSIHRKQSRSCSRTGHCVSVIQHDVVVSYGASTHQALLQEYGERRDRERTVIDIIPGNTRLARFLLFLLCNNCEY